jgi:hypothetical protein
VARLRKILDSLATYEASFQLLIARIALITVICLLLIIVGALYFGRQQRQDVLLRDIYRCGDRVCALGIAPDITPFATV